MAARAKRTSRPAAKAKSRRGAAKPFAASWKPPENYQEKPNLRAYLKSLSPRMHTAEMYMVLYLDWTTRPFWRKSIDEAWADLGLPPTQAREAIDKRIVLLEIYDRVLARAQEPASRMRLRRMPT